MNMVRTPIPTFYDLDGSPLENGYVYVGTTGLDARTNPIQVYTDAALSVTIAQPIRTIAGYPAYQGAPVQLYVAEDDFRVTVLNRYELTVFENKEMDAFATVGVLDTELTAGLLAKTNAVATRAAMAALGATSRTSAALHESGREGLFRWSSASLSAEVTADSAQGIYVAPSTDTTGASGAWVRVTDGTWRAEWFGAAGDGTTNDTAALEGMGDFAATVGSLHWVMVPGKTYTTTNPYFLSGISGGVRIDGHGAKLQSIRGTLGLTHAFVVNYAPLVFADIYTTNGRDLYDGSNTPYEYGQRVDNAAAGDLTITLSTGEVSQMVEGKWATIYGYGRQTTGHPPNPVYFEDVFVTDVTGQVVTIARPLRYDYYSDWPAIVSGTDFSGPARILSHSRDDFEAIDHIEINGLTLAADPGWTDAFATQARNGRLIAAGYHTCTLRGVRGEGGMYPSQGTSFFDYGSRFDGAVEVDKLITNATIDGVEYGTTLSGGSGCRNLTIRNSYVNSLNSLQAIDNLDIENVRTAVSSSGSSSIIGDTMGTKNVSVINCSFSASESANVRLFGAQIRSAVVTVVDDTTIDMLTADFVTSAWYRSIFHKTILYNASNQPAFECNSTPRESGGRVSITGRFLQAVATNDTLTVPFIRNFRGKDNSYFGTYARPVVDISATSSTIVPTIIDSPGRAPGRWMFNQSEYAIDTVARYFHLGPAVQPTRMIINVSRAYTGATAAVSLVLRRAPTSTIFASIDLLTTGTRVLDLSGVSGSAGADSLTGIGTALVYAVQYATAAAVAYATDDEEAIWSVMLDGLPA